VIHHDPRNPHDERLIVDGGLLSNFPVWLFDVPDGQKPRWPTFGLLLVAPNQREPLVPGPHRPRTGEGKVSIHQSGREAAAEFLKTWNFDAYIKAFRQGDQPTRRQRVAAVMQEQAR
jgi:predicted acylesterase/phospholipase RssA